MSTTTAAPRTRRVAVVGSRAVGMFYQLFSMFFTKKN